MTFQNNAFVNFVILTIAFTQVTSWTIDLPEVRKYLFEKNEQYKKYSKNDYKDYVNSDHTFYSNIEGNSKHNSEDYKHERHDYEDEKHEEYGHENYMEKKVNKIMRDGGWYLEGLQRSLEDYSIFLESCNRQNSSSQNTTATNSTSWSPAIEPPSNSSAIPGTNSSMLNFENYDNSTVPMRPRTSEERRGDGSFGRGGNRTMSCEEAREASEQVRRFADLALHTTKRLQDLAYAKKYQKTDEQEENELILKLAWFLDRLAYLSGYEPVYKDYEPRRTTSTPTLPPTMPTLVPSSPEMTRELMDCLKQNSSEPPTVRCRYTGQIPDLMQRMMGMSGTTESPDPNSVLPMNVQPDSNPAQSSEILITSDSSSNTLLPATKISKRSTDYTYYFPPKPLHELTYPVPLVKLIKHRLSNIKSVVKSIVERRLAHLAEKKEEKEHFEKHHFEKRSIDENKFPNLNLIRTLSNPKPIVKSVEKRPLDEFPILIRYPISDVSVINTKSFKKRSIDDRKVTSNHINRMSNLKSIAKSIKKSPMIKKKFEYLLWPIKNANQLLKYPVLKSKSIKKRYTDDPLSKLANYYIKYKVWDSSNPLHKKKNFDKKNSIFEVKNQLNEPRSIQKRSLFSKKVVHMNIPKPIQVVRTYIHGHRHHHVHTIQKPKLLQHLHKLHELKHKKVEKIHKIIKKRSIESRNIENSDYNLEKNQKTIEKRSLESQTDLNIENFDYSLEKNHEIHKRSLKYEHMYLPRVSADPQGDISYYIKNKEGTNYNPSLLQAGQVRLGLEQVFQTGNIEIVRRFGANYNPLNPAPFYTGVLLSMADA